MNTITVGYFLSRRFGTWLITLLTASEPRHIDHEAKNDECLRSLRATDPRDDKITIQNRKDDLLGDSFAWILKDKALID
jgi:hypothetical protein